MKVVVIHPGTQHAKQLSQQLHRNGLLYYFITGLAISQRSLAGFLLSIMPKKLSRFFSNRVIHNVPKNKILNFPFIEWYYTNIAKKQQEKDDVWLHRNQVFQNSVPLKIIKACDVIIGFDTASWILADMVKQNKKKFILDLSTIHPVTKNIILEEVEKKSPLTDSPLKKKSQKFIELEKVEYSMADAIVVASSFSKKSLVDNDVPEGKIFLNPYGINAISFKEKEFFYTDGIIKLLYVGSIDNKKGIFFLLNLIKDYPKEIISLSLVGSASAEVIQFINLSSFHNIRLLGKLSHNEVALCMQEHDIFVFPSYFDGFGLVILEAMASCLPVITTLSTGGTDVIECGHEGFLVPAGNKELFKEKIDFFIEQPQQIKTMGMAARKKAEQFTWDAYGDRWEKIIEQVLSKA